MKTALSIAGSDSSGGADIEVDACKTGMLGSAKIVDVVEDCLTRNKLQPYVCDPVMVAKSGDELAKDDAVAAMKKRLFPLAAVVTPNRREAAALAGLDRKAEVTLAVAKDAARRIVGAGARAVVIKALDAGGQTVDLF